MKWRRKTCTENFKIPQEKYSNILMYQGSPKHNKMLLDAAQGSYFLEPQFSCH